MTVGEKIKKYRLERDMTQEELGRHLGVGKAAVQKYESGQVQNLKSQHIKILCRIFDSRPWDFIFDDDEDFSNLPPKSARLPYQQKISRQFTRLNEIGLRKLEDYLTDLLKIDEYKVKKF